MNKLHIVPLFVSVFLSGCAAFAPGPSMNVLPTQGKPFDTFKAEDATCRQWAEQQSGMPAQQVYERNAFPGAAAGTAVGAGLGAAVGSASGNAKGGALVGGAGGMPVGSSIGSTSGRTSGWEAQRRYDNTYQQCMYAYGNQLPGYLDIDTFPADDVLPPDASQLSPELEDFAAPTDVYLDDPPQFIYSPALNMYVAVGVPYDLVYTGREYFYFFGGQWYRGPYYNGPWEYVPRRGYPPAFMRHRINNIRRFRDLEFKRYERDRAHYDGRFHRPDFRGERRIREYREHQR